jgi:hypothetical protein
MMPMPSNKVTNFPEMTGNSSLKFRRIRTRLNRLKFRRKINQKNDWRARSQRDFSAIRKTRLELRRVLLSAEIKENLSPTLFGQTDIVSSNVDALWFSRASFEGAKPGS